MGDRYKALKKVLTGERKKKSSKGKKRKNPVVKRSLSAYTLTQAEMEEIHMLSDAAKIHHGFNNIKFLVENSNEEERLNEETMSLEAWKGTLEPEASRVKGNNSTSKGSGKRVHVDVVYLSTDIKAIADTNMDIHELPSNRAPSPPGMAES